MSLPLSSTITTLLLLFSAFAHSAIASTQAEYEIQLRERYRTKVLDCVYDADCIDPNSECNIWTNLNPMCRKGLCACKEGYKKVGYDAAGNIKCALFVPIGFPCNNGEKVKGLEIWATNAVCRPVGDEYILKCPTTPTDNNNFFTIPEWLSSRDLMQCYQNFTQLTKQCLNNDWCDPATQKCAANAESIQVCQCKEGFIQTAFECRYRKNGDQCDLVKECTETYADGDNGKICFKNKCDCKAGHAIQKYYVPPKDYFSFTDTIDKCFHTDSVRAGEGAECTVQAGFTWEEWKWWEAAKMCDTGMVCSACPEDLKEATAIEEATAKADYLRNRTLCRSVKVLDKLILNPNEANRIKSKLIATILLLNMLIT